MVSGVLARSWKSASRLVISLRGIALKYLTPVGLQMVFVLSLLLIMGGCQTFSAMPVVPKAAKISVVRYPEINVETSAELGDSITSYTIETRYTAGRILNEVRGSNYLMGIKPILPPQELELLGTYLGFDVYSASQCSVAVSGNFGAISPCAYGSYFSILHDAVRNRWGVSLPDISGDEYSLKDQT